MKTKIFLLAFVAWAMLGCTTRYVFVDRPPAYYAYDPTPPVVVQQAPPAQQAPVEYAPQAPPAPQPPPIIYRSVPAPVQTPAPQDFEVEVHVQVK